MFWGELYGLLTLLTLWVALKDKDAGIALFGLGMWLGLANIMNEPGIVHRDMSVIIDIGLAVYCLGALALRWTSLMATLFVISVGAGFWSLYGPELFFKDAKNLMLLGGLIAIWISTRTIWLSSRSSPL